MENNIGVVSGGAIDIIKSVTGGAINLVSKDDYEVAFKITSQWEGAFNADIIIKNISDKNIDNWSISFTMPHSITNIWNGVIHTKDNGGYIIHNAGSNQDIPAGQSVRFGFTAKAEGEIVLPKDYELLCYEETVPEIAYEISFKVTSDWVSAFNGEIQIKNISDVTIEDWKLEFDFDREIERFWTADILSVNSNHYCIKNKGYNANIKPGETLSLGFVGNPGNVTTEPTNYKLNNVVIKKQPKILNAFSEYGINFLQWTYEGTYNQYTIYKATKGTELSTVATITNANYYIDGDVIPGTTYDYHIVAFDKISGERLVSNTVSLLTTEEDSGDIEVPEDRVQALLELEADYDELDIIYADNDWAENVTQDIILSSAGYNGSSITWSTNNENSITANGIITRNPSGDCEATLTATLQHSGYMLEKEFHLIVIRASQPVSEIKDMTWDDIKELNGNELPPLRFYENGELNRINGKYTDMLVYTAEDAKTSIESIKSIIGINDVGSELMLYRSSTDNIERIFYFNQYYKGIPILGASITVIADRAGNTSCLNSSYMQDLSIVTEPSIDNNSLINIALDKLSADQIQNTRLVLFREDDESDKITLCWEIITKGELSYKAYLDANTGDVIYKEDLAYSVAATGTDIFGNTRNFTVKTTGILKWKKYYLQDTKRKLSLCDGTGTDAKDYVIMNNSDNVWNDPVAVTAYSHAIKTYDFFSNLGWKGYDSKNSPMKIVVHYQKETTPGTWVDVSNAYGGGSVLEFGDGDGTTTRSYASDIDTVAHEFAHSVTGVKLSGIRYSNMSGAINEGYSDIFGELIDYKKDWIHGVDNRISGSPSRNLIDPTILSKPKLTFGSYYKRICPDDNHSTHSGCNDNGYVHTNCTIISHAAYLMNQKGITIDELASLWYKSYDYYYGKVSPDFYDCRDAVLEATDKLGFSIDKKKAIIEAFDEVNISRNDITITVLDATNNTVVAGQTVSLVSSDKKQCKLTGSCCNSSACRYVNCDPDTCRHFCESSCSTPCTIAQNKCCNESTSISRMRATDNSGMVEYDDVVKGYHRVRIRRDQYEYFNEVIYIDDYNKNITVMLETPYENSISGKIAIADEDTNIANNLPLGYANITLTKKTGMIVLTKSTYTDANGMYSFNDIPAGEYELTVSKYGYIKVIQTIVIERGQNQYYNLVIESISDEYKGLGFAGGTIIDAFTGDGVSDLTLQIFKGIHIIPGVGIPSGTLVETLETGTNGIYHTSALDAGNYTVVVTDNREGVETTLRYYKSMFVIKTLGNTDILSQNGSVSRGLENNQLRIVLTWGSTPRDLDSHLSIALNNGSNGYVYYANKSYRINSTEVANLDLDDTSSYGPETTTIYTEIDGIFTFRVHDYTNGGSSSSQALANSGAIVSVYSGYLTVPIRIYYVPTGQGVNWNVFSYDSKTGKITTINTLN